MSVMPAKAGIHVSQIHRSYICLAWVPAFERVKKLPAPIAVMAGLDPRLSGLILWTERMTLILLLSGRFATIWTRKGINAM
ncbi:MAG: hypothetical protein ACLPX9_03895, partial [Rhodomicrobium sp.]